MPPRVMTPQLMPPGTVFDIAIKSETDFRPESGAVASTIGCSLTNPIGSSLLTSMFFCSSGRTTKMEDAAIMRV